MGWGEERGKQKRIPSKSLREHRVLSAGETNSVNYEPPENSITLVRFLFLSSCRSPIPPPTSIHLPPPPPSLSTHPSRALNRTRYKESWELTDWKVKQEVFQGHSVTKIPLIKDQRGLDVNANPEALIDLPSYPLLTAAASH